MLVVELLPDRAAELLDERLRVDEVEGAHALADDAGGRPHQLEVRLDLAGRLRPLHLDDDLVARRQRRAVHLADRRGGDRHLVEREERLLERQAHLLLDHPPHVGERDRRHVVLQAAELGDDVGRHHVGPGGEELAELDEGRAELVEHLAQAPAAVGELRVVVAAPPVDQVAEAVARGDAPDLGQPADPPLRFRRRHRLIVDAVARRG